MLLLTRADGTQVSFSDVFLASVLSSMLASGQSYTHREDVAIMNAGVGLLLIDTRTSFGWKIAEQFEIVSAPTNAFNIGFVNGAQVLDLNSALAAVGYAGPLPVASLDAVHAAWYAAPAGPYVDLASNLVVDGGTFNLEPARLRSLAVGSGLTLASSADALTVACPTLQDKLNKTGDLLLTLSSPNASIPPGLLLVTPDTSWVVGPNPSGALAFQQGASFANRLVLSSAGASVNGQLAVLDNDARLTNGRAPTTGSVVDASVASNAAIAQSKIGRAHV